MVQSIQSIADKIIAREGGFVDDPDDPGGATQYGVSLRALRGLGRDINDDGAIDVDDIRALSRADARDLFILHYFQRPKIAALPDTLHPVMFDAHVHMGRQSVVILQRLLQQLGHGIADDGLIGPQTAQATAIANRANPTLFLDGYSIERRIFYFRLGDQRPALRKYIRRQSGGKGGWITRAESFLSHGFHMTDQEFAKRVAQWV
jgi:lysozyme family protein